MNDIDRAFGVLQARFAIVRFPAFTWSKDQITDVITACVILHNMITESESEREHIVLDHRQGPQAEVGGQVPPTLAAFLAMCSKIRDTTTHHQLQDDLVYHLCVSNLRELVLCDSNLHKLFMSFLYCVNYDFYSIHVRE
jgi:hypothetical protein